eukprot:56919-Alexandrium_andersonii.AAC.1
MRLRHARVPCTVCVCRARAQCACAVHRARAPWPCACCAVHSPKLALLGCCDPFESVESCLLYTSPSPRD